MHQIRFRLGLGPRPHWPCLQRSLRPPSWIWGDLFLNGGRGRKRKGKEGKTVIKARERGRKGQERGREKREGERGVGIFSYFGLCVAYMYVADLRWVRWNRWESEGTAESRRPQVCPARRRDFVLRRRQVPPARVLRDRPTCDTRQTSRLNRACHTWLVTGQWWASAADVVVVTARLSVTLQTSVREYVFYVFFQISKKTWLFTFFWNDLWKKRKRSLAKI